MYDVIVMPHVIVKSHGRKDIHTGRAMTVTGKMVPWTYYRAIVLFRVIGRLTLELF